VAGFEDMVSEGSLATQGEGVNADIDLLSQGSRGMLVMPEGTQLGKEDEDLLVRPWGQASVSLW